MLVAGVTEVDHRVILRHVHVVEEADGLCDGRIVSSRDRGDGVVFSQQLTSTLSGQVQLEDAVSGIHKEEMRDIVNLCTNK